MLHTGVFRGDYVRVKRRFDKEFPPSVGKGRGRGREMESTDRIPGKDFLSVRWNVKTLLEIRKGVWES